MNECDGVVGKKERGKEGGVDDFVFFVERATRQCLSKEEVTGACMGGATATTTNEAQTEGGRRTPPLGIHRARVQLI